MAETEQGDLTTLTVQLLSAYVANNSVPSNELAALIETTRTALAGKPAEPEVTEAAVEHKPAVSARKSTSNPEHIISMIDGKAYKTLTRHIGAHGLTAAEYRERYNLPKSYPMVAPAYAQHRREIAEKIGLGRKRAGAAVSIAGEPGGAAVKDAAVPPPAVVSEPAVTKPATRGRAGTPKAKAPAKTPRPAPAKRAVPAKTAAAAPEAPASNGEPAIAPPALAKPKRGVATKAATAPKTKPAAKPAAETNVELTAEPAAQAATAPKVSAKVKAPAKAEPSTKPKAKPAKATVAG